MPFSRPTLSELISQAQQDIQSGLSLPGPLLRFSNLGISAQVLAGLANLHYGYLDWIAKQAVPFTAEDEFLIAWGALKGVLPKAAQAATGTVRFTGGVGTAIPINSVVTRSDQVEYYTTAAATIGGGGTVDVAAQAVPDPAGLTGAIGNCDAGTPLTLAQTIPNVQSACVAETDFTGGADIESQDDYRSRVMLAYQSLPSGGNVNDYVLWAEAVAGVTRAWCLPNGLGAGTVIVYTMFDFTEAAHNGFPQGTNGVATSETRASAATGDQLAVANYIYPLRPVTALVYSYAPQAAAQNFTISGLSTAGATVQNNVKSAIKDVFFRLGSPLGATINLSDVESAIAAVPGTTGFVITSPAANINTAVGYLPTLGTATFT